jgi:hypothetical protein
MIIKENIIKYDEINTINKLIYALPEKLTYIDGWVES